MPFLKGNSSCVLIEEVVSVEGPVDVCSEGGRWRIVQLHDQAYVFINGWHKIMAVFVSGCECVVSGTALATLDISVHPV